MVKAITIRNRESIEAINEIAQIEERRPHDSAERLFIKATKNKLARLKRKAKK